MNATPPLLRMTQVAARLSISRTAAYALADSGQLPSYRIGRSVRVAEADLQKYLARCKRGQ